MSERDVSSARCRDAPAALRASVADLDGPIRELMDEAGDHVAAILAAGSACELGAVAVPVAVFGALSPASVPGGLLAAVTATNLAFDVLDDVMDGDRPACWSSRSAGEVAVGTHCLLVHAAQVIGRGLRPPVAERVGARYRTMLAEVANGQLRAQSPLTVATTPAEVATTIAAKSGAMLRRLAEIAAIAAGADDERVATAGRFGCELAIARQHRNDIGELLGVRTSDLRNRAATLVAAFALEGRPLDARLELLDTMACAAGDDERRHQLVVELAPAVAEVCVLVDLHLNAARAAASDLMSGGSGDPMLMELIEHTASITRREP